MALQGRKGEHGGKTFYGRAPRRAFAFANPLRPCNAYLLLALAIRAPSAHVVQTTIDVRALGTNVEATVENARRTGAGDQVNQVTVDRVRPRAAFLQSQTGAHRCSMPPLRRSFALSFGRPFAVCGQSGPGVSSPACSFDPAFARPSASSCTRSIANHPVMPTATSGSGIAPIPLAMLAHRSFDARSLHLGRELDLRPPQEVSIHDCLGLPHPEARPFLMPYVIDSPPANFSAIP